MQNNPNYWIPIIEKEILQEPGEIRLVHIVMKADIFASCTNIRGLCAPLHMLLSSHIICSVLARVVLTDQVFSFGGDTTTSLAKVVVVSLDLRERDPEVGSSIGKGDSFGLPKPIFPDFFSDEQDFRLAQDNFWRRKGAAPPLPSPFFLMFQPTLPHKVRKGQKKLLAQHAVISPLFFSGPRGWETLAVDPHNQAVAKSLLDLSEIGLISGDDFASSRTCLLKFRSTAERSYLEDIGIPTRSFVPVGTDNALVVLPAEWPLERLHRHLITTAEEYTQLDNDPIITRITTVDGTTHMLVNSEEEVGTNFVYKKYMVLGVSLACQLVNQLVPALRSMGVAFNSSRAPNPRWHRDNQGNQRLFVHVRQLHGKDAFPTQAPLPIQNSDDRTLVLTDLDMHLFPIEGNFLDINGTGQTTNFESLAAT